MTYVPQYKDLAVNGSTSVHYIEAGAANLPTLLLLHGFPSSSFQYRDFIPMLSDSYHVLAPDLPGFGLTVVPDDFVYTFDNLAGVIASFLSMLQVSTYAMYIFDYGAPVGLRLALGNPNGIKAIVTQNGNAYVQGLGHPFWNPIEELWKNNSQSQREIVANGVLTLEATRSQYVDGASPQDISLINPVTWHLDYLQNLQGPKNASRQLDLFYDYRTNVALYPKFQEYFRTTQVPLLAVWGKNDPAFIPAGAEAFKNDLPNATIRFVDAGHFALEVKRWEISRIVKQWFTSIGY